ERHTGSESRCQTGPFQRRTDGVGFLAGDLGDDYLRRYADGARVFDSIGAQLDGLARGEVAAGTVVVSSVNIRLNEQARGRCPGVPELEPVAAGSAGLRRHWRVLGALRYRRTPHPRRATAQL